MGGVVPQWGSVGIGQPLSEQHLHWLAFIEKDPHVTTGFGQTEGFFQRRERRNRPAGPSHRTGGFARQDRACLPRNGGENQGFDRSLYMTGSLCALGEVLQ